MKAILSQFTNWRFCLLLIMGIMGLAFCMNEAEVSMGAFIAQKLIGIALIYAAVKIGDHWASQHKL